MKLIAPSLALVLVVPCLGSAPDKSASAGKNPTDELPPHIKRITSFGERADWSRDGKRILFLSRTFGDAMEINLAAKTIRNLAAHYPHYGYTRARHLANGDILLSGPETLDPKKPGDARTECFLSVLDKSRTTPPMPLGTKCSEGPAVSRKRMHIAWTHARAQYPDTLPKSVSQGWSCRRFFAAAYRANL